jgi:hypothetical protein
LHGCGADQYVDMAILNAHPVDGGVQLLGIAHIGA